MEEKDEPESKKIYSIATGAVAVIMLAAIIKILISGKVELCLLYSLD